MDDAIDTTVANTSDLLVPEPEAMAPERGLDTPEKYAVQIERWDGLICSGALPKHVKTPQQALAIAAMGAEFGWPPMRSLRSIYVVDGNPMLSAQAMLALVREKIPGMGFSIVKQDRTACVVRSRRHVDDEWSEFSFTEDDAKQAGLLSKRGTVWTQYRADMLWARCISRMCRRLYPDVIQGCYVVGDIVEGAKSVRQQGQPNEDAAAAMLGTASSESEESSEGEAAQ